MSCPKCGADYVAQDHGGITHTFACGTTTHVNAIPYGGMSKTVTEGKECLRRQLAAMTQERDAWRAATGIANMTPEEAGEEIDRKAGLRMAAVEACREVLAAEDGIHYGIGTPREIQEMVVSKCRAVARLADAK